VLTFVAIQKNFISSIELLKLEMMGILSKDYLFQSFFLYSNAVDHSLFRLIFDIFEYIS
jgi:hypothetical protein